MRKGMVVALAAVLASTGCARENDPVGPTMGPAGLETPRGDVTTGCVAGENGGTMGGGYRGCDSPSSGTTTLDQGTTSVGASCGSGENIGTMGGGYALCPQP